MPKIRMALAQTNPSVGAFDKNLQDCLTQVQLAADSGANLVVFGEMAICGYPIEDLALQPGFLKSSRQTVENFASLLNERGLGEVRVVIGAADEAPAELRSAWAIAQNCAFLIHNGEIKGRYAKHHLPNYSVFDEYRIFVPGDDLLTFDFEDVRFCTLVCEDIWQDGGPVSQIANAGADVTLVLNGSPFEVHKGDRRLQLVESLSAKHGTAVAYVNLYGGQDDLVFDGGSLFVDKAQSLVARAERFAADLVFIDLEDEHATIYQPASNRNKHQDDSELANVWKALTLGLKDYVAKNGFTSVILGLSGGIDSALCATLAVDALGADNVFGVSMPSKYSSEHSKTDAFDLAERLNISIRSESIEPLFEAGQSQLNLAGLAAENLQARIRGMILMSISNAEGQLCLTTGNKTELAVGYSTIYGDSVGGFAPIKDVPKTMVWQLAKWRNQLAKEAGLPIPIPENSISKPPSAELREGQLDQDSLPDYELLDRILEDYISERKSVSQLIANGYEPAVISQVIKLVTRAEWKRRQGAIGPKISALSFGRERRMPVTNKFDESATN